MFKSKKFCFKKGKIEFGLLVGILLVVGVFVLMWYLMGKIANVNN